MRNYIKMKRAEWKVKAMIYGTIATILDNQKEVLNLLQKMYVAIKDIPAEDLQKELISKLAEIIYDENKTE